MTFRRLLLCALFLGLIVGMGNANVIGNHYLIPKTSIAPTIDGELDSVWKTLDWNFQTSYDNGRIIPSGYVDLFGMNKLMYDDNFLYGIMYVQDDTLVDTHANTYEKDGIEFYIDGDNSKSGTYDGVNDQQLRFTHSFVDDPMSHLSELNWAGWCTADLREGTEFSILDDVTTMGGWWLEFKIPLVALGIEGALENKEVGLEWQSNDNDTLNRESISKWWLDTGDDSWSNTKSFGTATLTERVLSNSLEIKKLPAEQAAPVIDGVMDDIYKFGNRITVNHYGNGNTYPVDFADFFTEAYLLWDDNYMYCFANTSDDTLVDTHANTYERDNLEIYFDGDNSKSGTYDGVNDQQLRFQHLFYDDPNSHLAELNWAAWCTADLREGTELGIVDTETGWALEFKIPHTALGITAPTVGVSIGFELQGNDNDVLNRESITKWWLASGDDSWSNSKSFGTAYLGSELVVVDVRPEPAANPDKFGLAQNYPNPFNPITTIPYALQSNGKVRLTVYDITGREVKVLVNGFQTAGAHQVSFNASNLSSGIYFYKLQAADNVLTKKMMLLK